MLPLWFEPVEITPEMTTAVRRYYVRRNAELSLIDNAFRDSAMQQLQRAGMPDERMCAPLDPEVEGLVKALVKGERLTAWFREQLEPDGPIRPDKPFDGHNVDRDLCVRVIGMALIGQPARGHAATAKFLNEGLSPGAQGLDRHHVIRAYKSLQESWRRSPCRDRFLYILIDSDRLRALNVLYDHARAASKLRKYRGEELAWAIHEQFDLNESVSRVSELAGAIRRGVKS
jgi:hypothetical protein